MANMRELFPEFYMNSELSKEDFEASTKNLVVIDTNILLNILRFPTELAEKYVETIKLVKDILFVPYIVSLEFTFNKEEYRVGTETKIENYINSISNSLRDKSTELDLESILKNKEQTTEVEKSINEIVDQFQTQVKQEIKNIFDIKYTKTANDLTKELIEVLDDSIAEKFNQTWIDKVQAKGKIRYQKKIPPGYDDVSKSREPFPYRAYSDIVYERQYGDYILWEEILHKVAKDSTLGNKVILVTNDGISRNKRDLIWKEHGKKIGPRIELKSELWNVKSGYSILDDKTNDDTIPCKKELHIITGERFLTLVNGFTDEEAEKYESDDLNFQDDSDTTIDNIDTNSFKDIVIQKISDKESELQYLSDRIKNLKIDRILAQDSEIEHQMGKELSKLKLKQLLLQSEIEDLGISLYESEKLQDL